MVDTLISIYDRSATNALFNGTEQFFFANKFTMSGGNKINDDIKTHQPSLIAADGTTQPAKWQNSYNRKKSKSQYSGFANNTFSITIIFKEAEKNMKSRVINGNAISMLTLAKIMHFIRFPKTYYLKDPYILSKLIGEDYSYYVSTGFPVVISTWSIETDMNNGDVNITLGLKEDYDENM